MKPRTFVLGLLTLGLLSSVTATTYDSQLLHPVAGDVVYAGQPYTVSWTVDSSFSTLNLVILGDNYNDGIALNISNTGSYIWNVETSWPSTDLLYMVLSRVDWNTNNETYPFMMVSVEDQMPLKEAYLFPPERRLIFCSFATVTSTQTTATGCPSIIAATSSPVPTVHYTTSCPQFTPAAWGTVVGLFFLGLILGFVGGALLGKQCLKRKRDAKATALYSAYRENGRIKADGAPEE